MGPGDVNVGNKVYDLARRSGQGCVLGREGRCATPGGRVRPELDYPTGNWIGTGISVLVNPNWNGFQEFWFWIDQNRNVKKYIPVLEVIRAIGNCEKVTGMI